MFIKRYKRRKNNSIIDVSKPTINFCRFIRTLLARENDEILWIMRRGLLEGKFRTAIVSPVVKSRKNLSEIISGLRMYTRNVRIYPRTRRRRLTDFSQATLRVYIYLFIYTHVYLFIYNDDPRYMICGSHRTRWIGRKKYTMTVIFVQSPSRSLNDRCMLKRR